MSEQTNIFEQATRQRLRFVSVQGALNVEDLWTLPLTSKTRASLDAVAIQVNRELKAMEEESFVETRSTRNTEAELKMAVVKHIIEIRKEENAAARQAIEREEKKQKIMRILESKENADLENKSTEDLQKMLDEL